jgi:hypothetical protein
MAKELDKNVQAILQDARDTLAKNYLGGAEGFVAGQVILHVEQVTMNESNTFTGNTNPIIIIHSHVGDIRDIHQTINAAPIDTEKKKELSTLVDQLRAALERVPGDRAEAVAKQLKQTMEEITQPAPNKIGLGESIGRMLRTAKDVAEVLPIATKIGTMVAGMFGVPLPS